MTPNINDKFGKASISAGYATATTVKTARTKGVVVLETFNLSAFAPDTPVFFVTYKKTTDPVTNKVTVTNQTSWKALVNPDNNTLTNLTLAPGYTDIGNEVGDFVECIPTSFWGNSLIEGLFVHMNPDGTLKASAVKSALGNDGNLVQALDETLSDFVVSGGAWATLAGLNAGMSALTAYIDGYKNTVATIATRAFTPSKDIYIDVLRNTDTNAFSLVYTEVANGATTGFALAANSIRLAKVVTSATAITSILQNAFDSIGNPVRSTYPVSQSKIINPYKFRVYRTAAFSTTAAAETIIPFDTKSFDSSNNVDIVTNKGRFKAPVAGFYHFDANVSLNPGSTALVYIGLKVNGVFAQRGNDLRVTSVNKGVVVAAFLQLAANDYVEAFCYTDVATPLDVAGATSNTTFSGFLVSQM